MKIEIIASGSSGNCYMVSNDDTTLLIECGIRYRRILEHLKHDINRIDACLVTHEHMDHAKVAKDLINASVDVFMTAGTKEALELPNHHRLSVFKTKDNDWRYEPMIIGQFIAQPFQTIHDAKEPCGFYIHDRNTTETLLFATDTAYIEFAFPPINYLMIECNYIKEFMDQQVFDGKTNLALRNRIVKSHMSLERLMEFLEEQNLEGLKEIYLLHLSDFNSDEKLIYEMVAKKTGKRIVVA